MENTMNLTGIHHLTAVSAQIRENHHFYTQKLGMRLVKRSVNQDDVSAYHLFYADALAWWAQHLRELGVTAGEITQGDGRLSLDIEEPEGQRLTLVDDGGVGEA